MTEKLPHDAIMRIEQQWELPFSPENISLEAQEANEARFREALTERVQEMLTHHFDRLVHALRRLDVRERDFHAAMQLPNTREMAEALTMLILQREWEKSESRRKFREQQL